MSHTALWVLLIISFLGCDRTQDPSSPAADPPPPVVEPQSTIESASLPVEEPVIEEKLLPPQNKASAIRFKDQDPSFQKVSGTITIERAKSEDDLTHYVLYWKGNNTPLAELPAAAPLKWELPANTSLPPSATLLVKTKNEHGFMEEGVSLTIQDRFPPKEIAQTLLFKDTDLNPGVIQGTLKVALALKHPHATHYHVYWGNSESADFSQEPIKVFKARGNAQSIKLKSQPLSKSRNTLWVFAARHDIRAEHGKSLQVHDRFLPTHSAQALSFQDQDLLEKKLSGTLFIQPASDESSVTHYEVHWGSFQKNQWHLHQQITEIPAQQTQLTVDIPSTVSSAENTHLLVYTKNDVGRSQKPAALKVQDLVEIMDVSTGLDYACVLYANQKVYCWGEGSLGQLGNGKKGDSVRAFQVPELLGEQIDSGLDHTCVVRSNQTAMCWGHGFQWKLGTGKSDAQATPKTVFGLRHVQEISAGGSHSCALLNQGQVKCWGNGIFGQLGISKTTSVRAVSVNNFKEAAQISAGAYHTCAVTQKGDVYCWGAGQHGQLGNGATSNQNTPTKVNGLQNVRQVVAGGIRAVGEQSDDSIAKGSHTCALTRKGDVYCWGSGQHGQLGNGKNESALVPQKVSQLKNIQQLALGESHTCALSDHGGVYCWGLGESGQLGNGEMISSNQPVFVDGLGEVTHIAAGPNHTLVVIEDSMIWLWGHFQKQQTAIPQSQLTHLEKR